MLALHAAKLLSSRLWKKASYTNPPRFIINGSTAHTARIVLTFLHDAFKDRVISYRITQVKLAGVASLLLMQVIILDVHGRRTKSLQIGHKAF
jgi:hypothetical protein